MARPPVFLLAASALAFAACGPKVEVAPAEPAAPAFFDEWYSVSAIPPDAAQAALNIHETEQGPQGRIWQDGKMYSVRNLVVSDAAMSFMAPGLDISWSATKDVAGEWSGSWTSGDSTLSAVLSATNAPDLGGKQFVTLPDGRQMYLDCRGTGAPTVIFDAGAGGWSKDWSAVHDEIAATTTACAYDRAGHGLSDPRPLPLDAATVADDLDAMLAAAKIDGPYVLVGHSLGSYHVRQFANTRFERMAGMVLVDPSGDGQKARFNAVIPNFVAERAKQSEVPKAAGCQQRLREKLVLRSDPLFATCNGVNDPDLFEQTQSEIDSMEGPSTDQLAASRRSYGDMPLIVLTRGDYQKGMPPGITEADRAGMKQVWEMMHAEMAALSTSGEQRFVPGAGHIVQRDQPQAVIDAVNEVVAAARATAK